jgi:hypothetical protein
VVILATLVITPAVVIFFAKRVGRTQEGSESLAGTVLVPVWGAGTRPLLSMAGRLAQDDGGIVLAASFAPEEASEEELESQRALKDKAEEWLAMEGLESRTCFRVARTVPAGLFETVRAEKATLLLAERRSKTRERVESDTEAFRWLNRAPIPVVIANGPVDRFQRLVVLARREDLVAPGRRDLDLAMEVAGRIARRRPVLYVGAATTTASSAFKAKKVHLEQLESADPIGWALQELKGSDVLLFAGIDAADEGLERIGDLSDRPFLIAIAAHGAPAPVRETRSSGLVVGGGLTEAGA